MTLAIALSPLLGIPIYSGAGLVFLAWFGTKQLQRLTNWGVSEVVQSVVPEVVPEVVDPPCDFPAFPPDENPFSPDGLWP